MDSKYPVIYTGAGVSTSADIPDYRGPDGVWTRQDKGLAVKKADIEAAKVTAGHYVINQLVKQGFVKHVVSTNIDGLHMRSGLSTAELSELHGNSYLEKCGECGNEYLRDFNCTKDGMRPDHTTGRTCEVEGCNGALKDTIIHFKENLSQSILETAENHAQQSDLSIVLGTSMTVYPAASLPSIPLAKGGKMVIVNLQKTRYDDDAALNIRSKTDLVLLRLAQELGLALPPTTEVGVPLTPPTKEVFKVVADAAPPIEAPKVVIPEGLQIQPTGGSSGATPPTYGGGLGGRAVVEVHGEKSGKVDVKEGRKMVLVSDCSNFTLSLRAPPLKLLLDRCEKSVVEVRKPLLTGTLEVVKCKKVGVVLGVNVPTITLDMCTDCEIVVSSLEHLEKIVCSQCVGVRVLWGEGNVYEITNVNNHNQYVTHVVEGALCTEKIIREGGGYLTTEREKAEADARDAANREAAMQHMRGMIKSH